MNKQGIKTWKEFTEKQIKRMIKQVNDSLYRLEKAGVADESAMYRTIERYAVSNPNGTGKMYNVNMEKGTVRVSKDLKRYKTREEKNKFVQILQNILASKTRTVGGTRKALKEGFETIKKQYDYKGTFEEYVNVWRTYRNQVSKDRRDKMGSDKVMKLIENNNIYMLDNQQLNMAMSYFESYQNDDEALERIIQEFPQLQQEF